MHLHVCFAAIALALLTGALCAEAHSIKHIIVLLMENRGFDHLLGWRPGVDGLRPDMCNPFKVGDPLSKKRCVTDRAKQIMPCSPEHDTLGTVFKMYGATELNASHVPTMENFITVEYQSQQNRVGKYQKLDCEVMDAFSVENMPVINALADDFVLFDRFYASMPGPTWPNRLFHLAGTSGGLTETGNAWFRKQTGVLFPFRTILDQVEDAGLEWRVYVNDTPWELMLETIAYNPEKIRLTEEFFHDARNGKLPSFALINPRIGVNVTTGHGSNDQHTDHDAALGEAFYKDIYEALRAGPKWNDTLLILSYDENGGFYDHHAPPAWAPPPDDLSSYPDTFFKFDRPGMRVPTLLLSPWVPKHVVVTDPPAAAKPAKDSIFELTSIMATTRKLLGITEGPLTKRDAWAATFDYVLDILKEPRTDCPMHLPDALPPSQPIYPEIQLPVNSLQEHVAAVHAHLSGRRFPAHIGQQRDISAWLQESFDMHRRNVERGKRRGEYSRSRPRTDFAGNPTAIALEGQPPAVVYDDLYALRCEPKVHSPPCVIGQWTVPVGGSRYSHRTIRGKVHKNKKTTRVCWTVPPNPTHGSVVGISKCNGSTAQDWIWENDVTIRPAVAAGLCVTSYCRGDLPSVSAPVTLERCRGAFEQQFTFQGVGQLHEDRGPIHSGSLIMVIVMAHKVK